MKSPWWHLRRQPSEDETTPPEGAVPKKLVVTRRDRDGDPVEHAWVREEAWPDYDDTRWSDDWR